MEQVDDLMFLMAKIGLMNVGLKEPIQVLVIMVTFGAYHRIQVMVFILYIEMAILIFNI